MPSNLLYSSEPLPPVPRNNVMTFRFGLIVFLLVCSFAGLLPHIAFAEKANQLNACNWSFVDIPNPDIGVRSPVQFDTHAAYIFYLFELSQAQQRTALLLEGDFPFAAYMGFSIYDGANGYLNAAIVDHEIVPNPGSQNPFLPGTPVNTANRTYQVVVRPHGANASDHAQFVNQIEMPLSMASNPSRRALDLWLRIYGPNEGEDRLGGVALPKISAFDWDTLQPAACPQTRPEIPSYTSNDGPGPKPDPETGRIYFTRPPAYNTPFTDGTGPLDPATDCTGYLAGWLGKGEEYFGHTAVVHIHKLPEFWDNSLVTPDSMALFEQDPVRYISFGSYGVPRIPHQNLAAYEMKKLTDGGVAFYVVPKDIPDQVKQLIQYLAEIRGYNVLPMGSRLRFVPPFLVYRNKIVESSFEGNIRNVACNAAPPWVDTPIINSDGSLTDFVSNQNNMGPYWIEGKECTLDELLNAMPGSMCAPANGDATPPVFPAIPIPQQPDAEPVESFIGETASVKPVDSLPIPEHPFMAPNGTSNIHMDAYMSDTYQVSGPLGKKPVVRTSFLTGECGTAVFDSKNRIITLCPGPFSSRLFLIEPESLDTLATLRLPARPLLLSAGFGAGGYFYLDDQDRAIIPTANRTLVVVEVDDSGFRPLFNTVRTYDLTETVPENQSILSVLPDAFGLLWFTSSGGIVGTIDPVSGLVQFLTLPGSPAESITKSFAVDPDPDRGGVFIVSNYALYRFDANEAKGPMITWREPYDRGDRKKPGQTQQGSGTTPTLMGTSFITITDNADPRMHVLVYRRAREADGSRQVCSIPVFEEGKSATENSLIATERSIIVENNYGYRNFQSTLFGRTTEPGISRIDLDANEKGCHLVWTNGESVPNAVSQLSLSNGLLYTYTKDEGPEQTNAWYFTAIDFETGKTVYKQLTGTGFLYDSHYSAIYLGPNGTAFVGVAGGLLSVQDERLFQNDTVLDIRDQLQRVLEEN